MSTPNTPQTATDGSPPKAPTFSEMLASGAIYRHAIALVALAGFITLAAGLYNWASRPSMVPIFTKLSGSEAQQVMDTLRASSIPFEIENGSGLVLAPANLVAQARMKLAAEGIGSDLGTGIEMLQQEQSLGSSRFIENARYHHALETELSRTITAMRNIDAARVHLAIPKQSVFIRDRAKPSASVMVKLLPSRSLEGGQVSAIEHLVASSIPHLVSNQVTVINQYGQLLSKGSDMSNVDIANHQFDYTRKLETVLTDRIEQLLTPILGHGRVRAQVSADVDFSFTEETQELFDPDKGQIRSEESDETRTQGGSMAAVGVPGALANQPPAAATIGDNAGDGEAANESQGESNVSARSVRNYELDKTIKHSRKEQGTIRRLSVAVLVDDKSATDEAGEVVRTALSAEELDTLTQIVRETIGFDEARGDTVAVFNQAFQPIEEIEPVEPPPFWQEPWVWSIAKQVIIAFVILILALMLAKPALRNLKPVADKKKSASDENGEDMDALGNDQVMLSQKSANGQPGLPAPPNAYGDVLLMARGLADEDPKRVAKVIKTWVEENV